MLLQELLLITDFCSFWNTRTSSPATKQPKTFKSPSTFLSDAPAWTSAGCVDPDCLSESVEGLPCDWLTRYLLYLAVKHDPNKAAAKCDIIVKLHNYDFVPPVLAARLHPPALCFSRRQWHQPEVKMSFNICCALLSPLLKMWWVIFTQCVASIVTVLIP